MPELSLTPEDESRIRDWAIRYAGTMRGYYTITDGIRLLGEIDRLRAERDETNRELEAMRQLLHCDLCNNTALLEDGRECPRCRPNLEQAIALGK